MGLISYFTLPTGYGYRFTYWNGVSIIQREGTGRTLTQAKYAARIDARSCGVDVDKLGLV